MYHVIVNPSSKSGLAKKQWKHLKAALDHAKITYIVHFTKSEKELIAYTRSVTDKELYKHNGSLNRLIVLGGDGTFNCVINGIDDLEHTIVSYLPTGTSNDCARALGISADPMDTVCGLKKGGVTRQTDIGTVNYAKKKRRFAVSCGIGFDAATCDEVMRSPYKNIFNKLGLGKLIYCAIAIKQLFCLEPVSCDIYIDDQPPIRFHRFLFATAMQLPYEGGGFMLCPEADETDGLLELCVASNLTALQALPIFPKALSGKHVGHRGIHMFRGKTIRIVTSKPLCVHTDGEICGHHRELVITSETQKLSYRKA